MDEQERIAVAFNEAINARDLDALGALMADGHTFVDSAGTVLAGAERVLDAWRGFFAAFPDYRNEWVEAIPTRGRVIALGRSVCTTEPALDGPAIWTATIAGGKVAEWRVLDDTPANRRRLRIRLK
jgi:ketosteroid isomerase-like protein